MIEGGRAHAAAGTSDASPIPIVAWSSGGFWAWVAGAVAVLAAVAAFGGTRRRER